MKPAWCQRHTFAFKPGKTLSENRLRNELVGKVAEIIVDMNYLMKLDAYLLDEYESLDPSRG